MIRDMQDAPKHCALSRLKLWFTDNEWQRERKEVAEATIGVWSILRKGTFEIFATLLLKEKC